MFFFHWIIPSYSTEFCHVLARIQLSRDTILLLQSLSLMGINTESRDARAICSGFTKNIPLQCRTCTRALQEENSISPLFLGPRVAGAANDWCITSQV